MDKKRHKVIFPVGISGAGKNYLFALDGTYYHTVEACREANQAIVDRTPEAYHEDASIEEEDGQYM